MENLESGAEKSPYPHLNELINGWFKEHQNKYPDGAQINIDIDSDGSMNVSINEVGSEK